MKRELRYVPECMYYVVQTCNHEKIKIERGKKLLMLSLKFGM